MSHFEHTDWIWNFPPNYAKFRKKSAKFRENPQNSAKVRKIPRKSGLGVKFQIRSECSKWDVFWFSTTVKWFEFHSGNFSWLLQRNCQKGFAWRGNLCGKFRSSARISRMPKLAKLNLMQTQDFRTVFENRRKSLIQHSERSELFWVDKSLSKMVHSGEFLSRSNRVTRH